MDGDRMETRQAGRKTYRKPELRVKRIEVGIYGSYHDDGDDPPPGWSGGDHIGGGHGGGR